MAKVDTSSYKTFDQICGRLDDIIGQVRDKDTSLERSLDLFDEAIALGSKAVDLVDSTDFTPEEEARLEQEEASSSESAGADKDSGDAAASDKPEADDAASSDADA